MYVGYLYLNLSWVLLSMRFIIGVLILYSLVGISSIAGQSVSPNRVLINLITWTNANGYSSINWNDVTELSIFHVWINPNGSIQYDGGLQNLTSIIQNAHSHNVKVTLAIGGDGEDPALINKTLSNLTFQNIVINNTINEILNRSYDGVHVDFEGYYNSVLFTAFMQRLSSRLWSINPDYVIDVQIAPWYNSSFNLGALKDYGTQFNVMFNPTTSLLNSYSAQLGSASKLSACYDLSNSDNWTNLNNNIKTDRADGYGVCIWNEVYMNSTSWGYLTDSQVKTDNSTSITTSTSSISSTVSTSSQLSTSIVSITSTGISTTATSLTSTSIISSLTTTIIPNNSSNDNLTLSHFIDGFGNWVWYFKT